MDHTGTNQQRYSIRKIGIIIALVVALLWLLVYAFWPPSFSSIDVAYFKEAGINLAQGRGLVARADPHFGSLELVPYRTYPPLFPALYGLYSMVAGISAQASRFFDVALNIVAGLLFLFAVLPRQGSRGQLWPGLLLTLLVMFTLPAGPFWQERDRPEVIGFILIVVTLLLLQKRITYRRLAVVGLLQGLLLLTSPFPFLLNVLVILLLLGRAFLEKELPFSLGNLARLGLAGGAGFALPLVLALVLWNGLTDTDTVTQIVAHATGRSRDVRSGLGYFSRLITGDIGGYLEAISHYTNLGHKVRLAYLGWTGLLLSAFFIGFWKQQSTRSALFTWLMFIVVALTPVLLIPYQSNYMSLTAAVLLVLFARLVKMDTERARIVAGWLVVLGFGLIALFQMIAISRELYVAYRAGPSYAEMAAALEELRPDANQPPLLVATDMDVYFLFSEQPGFEPLPYYGLTLDQLREVDLYAFAYRGNGDPLQVTFPNWTRNITLSPVYTPAGPPPRLTLFNMDVTNGPDSWLVGIYRPSVTKE